MRASVSREQILPTGQLGNKKHDIGQNNHRAKPEILLSPGLDSLRIPAAGFSPKPLGLALPPNLGCGS